MRPLALIFAGIFSLWAHSAVANQLSGAYLAARHAHAMHDYASSATYHSRLIVADKHNVAAVENLLIGQVAIGQVDRAVKVATAFDDLRQDIPIINLLGLASGIKDKQYKDVVNSVELSSANAGALLIERLVKAWAMAGNTQFEAASEIFDGLLADDSLANFGVHHKALFNLFQNDYEACEKTILDYIARGRDVSSRTAPLLIYAVAMQGRFEDAQQLVADFYQGPIPAHMQALALAIEQSQRPVDPYFTSPRDGVAEAFLTFAQVFQASENGQDALILARIAEYLSREKDHAILLSGDILTDMEQYHLAAKTYDTVSEASYLFHTAELGRADVLSADKRPEEAIDVLSALTQSHPEFRQAFRSLGDVLRNEERYEEAARAYTTAIDLAEQQNTVTWVLFHLRGMTYERLGLWDNAEPDFRRALSLEPDQPYVLNYLGYSLVEKQMKLDEALEMIKRAVQIESDSGYIVDSLGWVLFRLKRFDEAVGHLEKAASLMPVDPIINDHLGDSYWAVGRKREAHFQWQRALSFEPEAAEEERIRKKIEVGLDQVLLDEGAEPLTPMQGDE